jgi:type I restriction enzyme S subunit
MSNKPLVPKLRFPEFRDAGEWEETRLSILAKRRIERNNYNKINRVLTNSAVNGVVDQRDFFEKDIANQGNLENYFIVDLGDYVYNPRKSVTAPVGPISKNKIGKGVMSPLYTVFRFDNEENDFYDHYFKTTYWHKYLKEIANTGARHDRMSISNDDFINMPLPFPSSEEQQRIADCLSSLDELTAAEGQKLKAYKAHKKGLMQKLFPAEGETVPELRFPEFRDKGEWEEKRLDKICEVNPSSSRLPETFIYIDLESVEGGRLLKKNIISREYAPSRAQRLLKSGDIIFQMVRPYQKNNYFFKPTDNFIYVASTGYAHLRAHESNSFLFQYLHNDRFVKKVIAKCSGSNYPAINSNDLSEIVVEIPSLPEQQRIADCLSSLDELIGAQGWKIEKLKEHKKGLMQGLFPSVGEGGE